MERKEFLAKLELIKGTEVAIEVEGEIVQKITMKQLLNEIKEDRLYIRNRENLDFAVINLNTIRDIQVKEKCMTIYLDNAKETKIKISAI